MKNRFLQQLRVSFQIWLLALATNTLVGTLVLARGLNPDLIVWGTILGTMYSFPIFLLLLLVINRCMAGNRNGLQTFRIVMLTGLVLTVAAWYIFFQSFAGMQDERTALLIVALMAASTSIFSHYKALFNLAGDHKYDNYLI